MKKKTRKLTSKQLAKALGAHLDNLKAVDPTKGYLRLQAYKVDNPTSEFVLSWIGKPFRSTGNSGPDDGKIIDACYNLDSGYIELLVETEKSVVESMTEELFGKVSVEFKTVPDKVWTNLLKKKPKHKNKRRMK